MTRAVHVAYLKGWTRTVPPFHARTYTRHPPSPLFRARISPQLVSASFHRENRRNSRFEVSLRNGRQRNHWHAAVRCLDIPLVEMRRLFEMVVPGSPLETRRWTRQAEWRRWRRRRLFQRNLCAPPCNYPAGSALNDFAVRIKSRRQRARRVRIVSARRAAIQVPVFIPALGLVTRGF